jgi:hypothetical protein
VYKYVCMVTENIMLNFYCFWSKYNYIWQKKIDMGVNNDVLNWFKISTLFDIKGKGVETNTSD